MSGAPVSALGASHRAKDDRVMNTTFETKIDEANRAFQDGDLDGAARRCAGILEEAPDHAGAHALLGTIRLSSGEFGAAAMSFRRAIASDRKSTRLNSSH